MYTPRWPMRPHNSGIKTPCENMRPGSRIRLHPWNTSSTWPLPIAPKASCIHRLQAAEGKHAAQGILHRLENQYELAQQQLLQAASLFKGLDTRWQLGRTHFELGDLATARSRPAQAKQHYATALELFEEMGAVPDARRAKDALLANSAEESS